MQLLTAMLFVMMLAISTNVKAQDQGDIVLGGGLSYGEKISELGLQFGGFYVYDEDFRFGGDFVYWLVDSPLSELVRAVSIVWVP